MCGIVGIIGNKNAGYKILQGLKDLEYRGYDSAGIATISKDELQIKKSVGKIAALEDAFLNAPLKGSIGIGHTRWATHGVPSINNAHPHVDCTGKIAVVHNGIIENFVSIRKLLIKEGHRFISESDTEVLAHLIEKFYNGNIERAVKEALMLVKGTYAIAVVCAQEPDKIIIARQQSPLVIGIIKKGSYIVASDVTPISKLTDRVIYISDNEMAILSSSGHHIVKISDLSRDVVKKIERIDWELEDSEKGRYKHFMLKEINEQPKIVKDIIFSHVIKKKGSVKFGGLESIWKNDEKDISGSTGIDYLLNASRIIIFGCGTSWHSGLIGEYAIENLAGLPVEVEYASEARYRNLCITKNDMVFAISQSGETADTLMAIKEAKRKGAVTFGLVNVVGSTIAREVSGGIYLHAGPEIGVASTKAFTGQVIILALMAFLLGRHKGAISLDKGKRIIKALEKIPEQMQNIINNDGPVKRLANRLAKYSNFLYLGRTYNFPVALEGALKLKEISYIHAEGYPAAEMKHGPIALIDKNMPVVVVATDTEDEIYEKIISNIREIKSRKGIVVAVASEGNKSIKDIVDETIYIPRTEDFLMPVLSVIPLQLLAYHIAVKKGCNVDKPRNLAKSVTVE